MDAFHASNCGRAVKKPGGGVQTFFVKALPFGATGSVAAFLRVAAGVAFIGLGHWISGGQISSIIQ